MRKKIAEHKKEIGKQPSPVIYLHLNYKNILSDISFTQLYATDTTGDDP